MVFRFRYRKCVVAALLTLAFMLSLLSNLDCTFVNVDIGFVPSNIYDPSSNASEYGIGLWTIEEADSDGLCILPLYVEDNISLTTDDDLYLSFLMSSDAVFTSARFIAFIGCFFGITVVTWAWTSVLFVFKNKSNRVTLNMTLAAFMCEGAKIGLLFMSNPCIDKEFWEKTDPDEVSSYHSADQCWVGRGCFISAGSCGVYFIVMIYAMLSMMFHDYSHINASDETPYDEITVPSFMQSLSMWSKNSSENQSTPRT